MAITKQKKSEIISKLKDVAKTAKSLVFVNFHGLPVEINTEMRRTLRANGIGLTVAKKTLMRKAFGEAGFTGELSDLPGEIAVAYGADDLAPVREVYAYQKKTPDFLKIVGGVFEGSYADQSKMMALATIPSREILYGQFVNVINSPIQGLVMALDQIAKKSGSSESV